MVAFHVPLSSKTKAAFGRVHLTHDTANDPTSVQNNEVIGAPRLFEMAAGLFENQHLSESRHRASSLRCSFYGCTATRQSRYREVLIYVETGMEVRSGPLSIPKRARPRSHPVPTTKAPEVGAVLFTIVRSRSASAKRVAVANFRDCCGEVTCQLAAIKYSDGKNGEQAS